MHELTLARPSFVHPETPLLLFSWLAVRRPRYAWSYCKRREAPLAAFLRKSGTLKVPEWWTVSSGPYIKSLLLTMRTGSTNELLPQPGTCTSPAVLASAPSPGRTENGGKGPRWGLQTDTSGTERDLDGLSGQVRQLPTRSRTNDAG